MQKNIFVGSVAVMAVIALSACQKAPEQGTQNTDMNESLNQQQIEEMPQEEIGMIKGSLKDLMQLAVPQKCEWTDGENMSGIVYIDGNRMRTEMVGAVGADGQPGSLSMINDGVWILTWDNTTKKGTKMKNDMLNEDLINEDMMGEDDMNNDMDESNAQEAMDNGIYDYSCNSWKVDEQMFVPPADIIFDDMSAILENIGESNVSTGNVCDYAPADQKDACLANLADINGNVPEEMMPQ